MQAMARTMVLASKFQRGQSRCSIICNAVKNIRPLGAVRRCRFGASTCFINLFRPRSKSRANGYSIGKFIFISAYSRVRAEVKRGLGDCDGANRFLSIPSIQVPSSSHKLRRNFLEGDD